jgi:hypothetical protein
MGVLQCTGSAIVVSPKLSEPLEILDPPISYFGTSSFAKLGSEEHILALCIGYKLKDLEWQIGTSNFSITYNFLDSTENMMLAMLNHSPLFFHL